MFSRRETIMIAAISLIGTTMPGLARTRKSSLVARLDTDHDGTVDLAEAKKAAVEVFDKLDADKDGTLTQAELHGRLSRKDFVAADPDADKTLSKDEYLAVVEQRFKSADADGDGSVSAAEFDTPAGRALARLLN
jgi:hypothetical protein